MTIVFPTAIDSSANIFPAVDNSTPANSVIINQLRAAIFAIEGNIGVAAQSSYGTIAERLNIIQAGQTQGFTPSGDLGGSATNTVVIGIQGNPVATGIPTVNSTLIWSGSEYIPSLINQNIILTTSGGNFTVKAICTSNVSLTSIPTTSEADMITINNGDNVLLVGQTNAVQNGVYTASGGALVRIGLLAGNNAASAQVWVDQGFYWSKTRWNCISTSSSDVIGTNNLVWERQYTLLDDLPFTSSDIFAFMYDETSIGSSGNGPLLNQVPGGAALTLTPHYGNTISPYTFLPQWSTPGPFNGMCAQLINPGFGFHSENAVVSIPATFTLTCWIYHTTAENDYSALVVFLGRAITAAPTGIDTSNFNFVISGQLNSNGGNTDYGKRVTSNLEVNGSFATILISTDGPSAQHGYAVPLIDQWTHYAWTFDGSTFSTWVNSALVSVSAAGTADTTSNGYWFIGSPQSNIADLAGNDFRFCRFRLSSGVWSQAQITEQYRRGKAWGG